MQIKNTTIKYLFFAGLFITLFVFNFKVFAFQDDFANWFEKPNEYSVNNNVSFPINTGNSFQTKNGALVVHGIRVLGPAVFDQGFKLANGAAQGSVLTSDADGNVSWQQLQGGGGEVLWGSITGNLENQTDLFDFLQLKADLNSPVFNGDPKAPTKPITNNSFIIATTQFIKNKLDQLTSLFQLNGWQKSGSVVSLITSTDHVSIGQAIVYRGDAIAQNRFIHNVGNNNFYFGLGAGNTNNSDSGTRNAENTGFGKFALGNLTGTNASCCVRNTAFGHQSLASNTLNNDNTAFGYQALYSNNSTFSSLSAKNTGIGYQALYNNTTGSNNTGIGYRSLFNNETGSGNTVIGYGADVSTINLSNAAAIGYNAVVSASDTMIFGNSDVVAWGFGVQPGAGQAIRVGTSTSNGNGATLTTGGVWTNASDLNKKTNIQNLNYGLKEVLQLRPVSFNWKDSNKHDIGFIAQEVKEIIPELVYGQEGDLSLAYSQLPVVLVNAVNEQNETLNQDKINFDNFEIELYELEKKIKNAN